MRSATFLAVIALALGAYAAEGPLPHTHLRRATAQAYPDFAVTDRELATAGVDDDAQREDIKSKVQELNAARKGLREQLTAARGKLATAQKEVNKVLEDLERQEVGFRDFIKARLGQNAGKQYAIRRELQPIIDWLKLDEAQVSGLMQAQSKLDIFGIRSKLAEAATLAREEAVAPRPDLSAMTPDQRKQYYAGRAAKRKQQMDLLKEYTDFERHWLNNIWQVIQSDPRRSRLWARRFRRSRYSIPGAPPPAKSRQ